MAILRVTNNARGRIRTCTAFRPADFKSPASTVSPPGLGAETCSLRPPSARPRRSVQAPAGGAVEPEKSLAIDPEFGRGYDGLGTIALNYDHDVAAAARHYEHALALDPTNIDILNNASFVAQVLGRLGQAIEMQEYAATRDPASPQSHSVLFYSYYLAGRYDDAVEAARISLSLSPGFLGAQANIAQALLSKGEREAALAAVRQEPSEIVKLPLLAMTLHALGQHADSDAALAQMIAKYEQSAAVVIAGVFAYRGESDRAFEWLEKAVAYHDPSITYLGVDPMFTSSRKDPRWLPLLTRLGLAPEQLAAISFEVVLPK